MDRKRPSSSTWERLAFWFWQETVFLEIQEILNDVEYYFSMSFNCWIIALQCCVGFCHTLTWVSHKYTHVPSFLDFTPTSYPSPPLQVVIEAWVKLTVLYSNFSLVICLTYFNIWVSMLVSQFAPPSPNNHPTIFTGLFSMSVSLIAALKVGSSVPFF